MEIEVVGNTGNGKLVNEACAAWHAPVVADGSLPDTGFEVNTAPASGDLFVEQIEQICEAIAIAGGSVDKRCGLHVHVDARDYKAFELRRLVKLYDKLEPALYRLLPPARRDSQYCRPCAKVFMERMEARYSPLPKRVSKREALRLMRRQLALNVYAPETSNHDHEMRYGISDRKKRKYDEARYYALNLHSYYFRGTVECRMHPGTIDAASIVNWGVLWAGILDYAYKHTERYIDDLVDDGYVLLRAIAPTQGAREYVQKCWELNEGR